jgi:hypothetical protein
VVREGGRESRTEDEMFKLTIPGLVVPLPCTPSTASRAALAPWSMATIIEREESFMMFGFILCLTFSKFELVKIKE